MASIQERLQIKREPLDRWSVREQLCLAVARNADQHWGSVSRALKPFGEPNRPADWFNQKNCAAQYGALLANVDTPKRKKRAAGGEVLNETPAESIAKKLLGERQAQLAALLLEERTEYARLQEDMLVLQSGKVSEEQLDKWCREIDEEEQRKEQESTAHAQWLRERELRKQEIERVFRPPAKLLSTTTTATPQQQLIVVGAGGQKRRISETDSQLQAPMPSLDDTYDTNKMILNEQLIGHSHNSHSQTSTTIVADQPAPPKPALSPLLTSLLKSPSQVVQSNVATATTSILHSAIITQQQQHHQQHHQRPTTINNINTTTTASTNPTIASLLNSSTPGSVTVSPGLQQLVSSAIGQQETVKIEVASSGIKLEDNLLLLDGIDTPVITTTKTTTNHHHHHHHHNNILDDPSLPNIKIEDIERSILVPDHNDGPLPEIKNEVDVIISDLIDSADSLVDNPDEHLLQVDANGDISCLNMDLDELEEAAVAAAEEDDEDVTIKKEIEDVKSVKKELLLGVGSEKDLLVTGTTRFSPLPSSVAAAVITTTTTTTAAVAGTTVVVDPFEFQEDPEIYEPASTTIKSSMIKTMIKQQNPAPASAATTIKVLEDKGDEEEEKEQIVVIDESKEHEDKIEDRTKSLPDCAEILKEDKIAREKQDEDNSADDKKELDDDEEEERPLLKMVDAAAITKEVEEETVAIKLDPNRNNMFEELLPSSTANNKSSGDLAAVASSSAVLDNSPNSNNKEMTMVQELEDGIIKSSGDDLVVATTGNVLIDSGESTMALFAVAATTSEDLRLYDDDNISMEVKIDKSGKAKRDYSRTKKKDDKDFDVLLTIEKVHGGGDLVDLGGEETSCYSDDTKDMAPITTTTGGMITTVTTTRTRKDSNSGKVKMIKIENDRSNSPWTEEEELLSSVRAAAAAAKRRYSSATPNDSVPNSPASSNNLMMASSDDDKDYKNWKKSVLLVYSRLATNKYASLFTKPITDDQAPGYHGIVRRPMDLQTIRRNIETGVIRTTHEFQRDVLLMLNNAIMYNKTNGTVFNMARQMQQESMQQIQIFLQAQVEVDAPIRRETRTSEPSGASTSGGTNAKRKRSVAEESLRNNKKRKDESN